MKVISIFFLMLIIGISTSRVKGQSMHVKDTLNENSDSSHLIKDSLNSKLDSVSNKLNASIDSLGKMNLPKAKYYAKVDSLFAVTRANLNSKKEFQFDSLKPESNELLKRYKTKLRTRQHRADSIRNKLKLNPDLNLPQGEGINANEFKVAGINTPQFDKPDMPGIPIQKPAVPTLNSALDMPGVDKPKEFDQVTDKLGEAKELQSKAGEYRDKAKDVKQVDAKEEAKKLPGELEKQAGKIDGVDELKKDLPQTGDLKPAVPELKGIDSKVSPDDLAKEIAKRKAKRVSVDHLAGQDQTIHAGLAKMEKLQRKYNSLADIRNLPKKRPNSMKDKAFIERVTPGMAMQVQALDNRWKAIDLSIGAEYFFNDQFRAGLQTSYRVNMMLKPLDVQDRDRVYGFRTVANYKIVKGFYGHMEGNAFRLPEYVKKHLPNATDKESRVWDYSLNVGIFKTYSINKQTRGTFLVLYDLSKLDETLNFGQIAVRFGLEYKLKRKKKEKTPSTGDIKNPE